MAESICCDCRAALASSALAAAAVVPPVLSASATAVAFCCAVAGDAFCDAVAGESPDALAVAAGVCCVSAATVAGWIFVLAATGTSAVAGFAVIAAFFAVLAAAPFSAGWAVSAAAMLAGVSAAVVLSPDAISASAFACGVLPAVSAITFCGAGWARSTTTIGFCAFVSACLPSSAVVEAVGALFSGGAFSSAGTVVFVCISAVCVAASTGAFKPSVGKSLPRNSAALKVASSKWKS